jgi:hypothetical protein
MANEETWGRAAEDSRQGSKQDRRQDSAQDASTDSRTRGNLWSKSGKVKRALVRAKRALTFVSIIRIRPLTFFSSFCAKGITESSIAAGFEELAQQKVSFACCRSLLACRSHVASVVGLYWPRSKSLMPSKSLRKSRKPPLSMSLCRIL